MLSKQEAEFGDVLKGKEFRDLASQFEDVGDPDMADLHKEMQRYGRFYSLTQFLFRQIGTRK